ERSSAPVLLVDSVESRQERMLLAQRERDHAPTGELRTAVGNGVARFGDDDRVAAGLRVEDDVGEREDRLLAAQRGDDLRVRIKRYVEPALGPRGDRLSELGQPGRGGVAHTLANPLAQCGD